MEEQHHSDENSMEEEEQVPPVEEEPQAPLGGAAAAAQPAIPVPAAMPQPGVPAGGMAAGQFHGMAHHYMRAQMAGALGGAMGYNFGMEGGRNAKGPHSLIAHSTLYMENPKDLEDTDKVILPDKILKGLTMLYGNRSMPHPLIFSIKNKKLDVTSHCGVLEFSHLENIAYLPNWMMEALFLDDAGNSEIDIELKDLPKATFVQFKPVTHELAKLPDPKTTLEHCLRKFTTLTKGQPITIRDHGKSYTLHVTELKMAGGSPIDAGCVVDTTLTVDFAVPLEEKSEEAHPEKIDIPCEIDGVVGADCHSYYKFKVHDNHMAIKIELAAINGDPDMYISTKHEKPEANHCDWSANTLNTSKEKSIFIDPSDKNFSNWFYVAVHAFKNSAQFRLTVSEEEPLSEEDIKVPERRRIFGEIGQPTDPSMTKCDVCWRFIPKAASSMHSLQCPRMNWRCKICNEIVKKTGKATHAHCGQCGKVMHENDVEKHEALVHVKKECGCGEKISAEHFKKHQKEECVLRPVKCKYCDVLTPVKALEEHENYCGSKSINCERCQKPVARKRMQIHLAIDHAVNPCLNPGGGRRERGDVAMDPESHMFADNPDPHRERHQNATQNPQSSSSSSSLPGGYGAIQRGQDDLQRVLQQSQDDFLEKQMQEALQASIQASIQDASGVSSSSSSSKDDTVMSEPSVQSASAQPHGKSEAPRSSKRETQSLFHHPIKSSSQENPSRQHFSTNRHFPHSTRPPRNHPNLSGQISGSDYMQTGDEAIQRAIAASLAATSGGSERKKNDAEQQQNTSSISAPQNGVSASHSSSSSSKMSDISPPVIQSQSGGDRVQADNDEDMQPPPAEKASNESKNLAQCPICSQTMDMSLINDHTVAHLE